MVTGVLILFTLFILYDNKIVKCLGFLVNLF